MRYRFIGSRMARIPIRILLVTSLLATVLLYNGFEISDTKQSRAYLPTCLFIVALSFYLLRLNQIFLHKRLDQDVSNILRKSLAITARPALVYLRPFSTDGKIYVGSSVGEAVKSCFTFNFIEAEDFESRLLMQILPVYVPTRFDEIREEKSFTFPFNFLSRSFGYRFGTHLQRSRDNWMETVKATISTSAICIVFPPLSLSSETAREIKEIMDTGQLEKTVFIMPSEPKGWSPPWTFKNRSSDGQKLSGKAIWDTLREIIKDNVHLPMYSKKGGYVLSINGNHRLVSGCVGANWWENRAIKAIFVKGELTGFSLKEAAIAAFYLACIIPIVTAVFLLGLVTFIVYLQIDIETWPPQFSIFLVCLTIASNVVCNFHYCGKYMLSKTGKVFLAITPILALLPTAYLLSSVMEIKIISEIVATHRPTVEGGYPLDFFLLLVILYFLTALVSYLVFRYRATVIFEPAYKNHAANKSCD